jgi:hypothetical protein
MEIIPPARVTRFEQLEPGELFLYLEGRQRFYALKTERPKSGDQSQMVLLGPTFFGEIAESFLVAWQPATVVSFGKNCSILLSNGPESWVSTGSTRRPVCLAIAGEKTYICTNGGSSPHDYFPSYVDVKTGGIIEARLPDSAAFTNTWEIAVLGNNHPTRTILRYPLESANGSQGAER